MRVEETESSILKAQNREIQYSQSVACSLNINIQIIKQPTAENIAVYVFNELKDVLKRDNCRLFEVEVWETKNSGVVYRG